MDGCRSFLRSKRLSDRLATAQTVYPRRTSEAHRLLHSKSVPHPACILRRVAPLLYCPRLAGARWTRSLMEVSYLHRKSHHELPGRPGLLARLVALCRRTLLSSASMSCHLADAKASRVEDGYPHSLGGSLRCAHTQMGVVSCSRRSWSNQR